MPPREHALVEDAADENAFRVDEIKNDVLLMFKAAVPSPDFVAWTADAGRFGDLHETLFEIIEVSVRLLFSPCFEGVIGDREYIKLA